MSASVVVCAPALSSCLHQSLFGGFGSDAGSPRLVDTHCHIFNARDIPVSGFLRKVVAGDLRRYLDNEIGYIITNAIAHLATAKVPGYDEEKEALEGLLAGENIQPLLDEFRFSDEDILEGLLPNSPRLVSLLMGLLQRDPFGLPEDLGLSGVIAIRYRVILGVFRFIKAARRFRFQNALELCRIYPNVILFTPALLDLEYWLKDEPTVAGERPPIPISQQIHLAELIDQYTGGRFRSLAPFDPAREACNGPGENGSLHWAKDAVQNRRLIGVKVYPPMGFAPWGNSGNPTCDHPKMEIDEALKSFYDWCIEDDVPIMTHTNNTLAAGDDTELNANPSLWENVLDQPGYEGLRINLGHLGGGDSLAGFDHLTWPWAAADMMDKYENVYADVGFHDAALARWTDLPAERKAKRIYLAHLEGIAKDGKQAFGKRLMYGSDWFMITLTMREQDYAKVFMKIARRALGDYSDDFLRGNALSFFRLKEAEIVGGRSPHPGGRPAI